MRYLLDTNVWADYLNQRYPRVSDRIQSAKPDDLVLSSIRSWFRAGCWLLSAP